MIACLSFALISQVKQSALVAKLELLRPRYAALNQAIRQANLPALKSWMAQNAAPDFSLKPAGGNMLDAAGTVSGMKDQFLIVKTVRSSTFKLGNFSAHADHLSVSVKTHYDALLKDRSRIVEDTLAVDTWVPVKGTWKLSSVVTTKDRFSTNGKVQRSVGINPGEVFP